MKATIRVSAAGSNLPGDKRVIERKRKRQSGSAGGIQNDQLLLGTKNHKATKTLTFIY